jgi:hypothetical protein
MSNSTSCVLAAADAYLLGPIGDIRWPIDRLPELAESGRWASERRV